jgi:hypothetical protein
VVVDGDRQLLLGGILADDVLVQPFFQVLGLEEAKKGRALRLGLVVFEDGIANCNALVTNVGLGMVPGSGDELPYHFLTFVTEGTSQRFIRSVSFHPELLRPTSRFDRPGRSPGIWDV